MDRTTDSERERKMCKVVVRKGHILRPLGSNNGRVFEEMLIKGNHLKRVVFGGSVDILLLEEDSRVFSISKDGSPFPSACQSQQKK